MANVDSDPELDPKPEPEQLYFSSLTLHGVTNASLEKLRSAGIRSCNQILIKTREFLDGVEGLEEDQPDKIWSAAESAVASEKLHAQTEVQRLTEIFQKAAIENTSEATQAACRSMIHCFSEYFTLIEIQRYIQEKHAFAPEDTATIFNGHISDNTEGGLSYLSHAVVASRQREAKEEAKRLKNKLKNKKKKEKNKEKKEASALVIEQEEDSKKAQDSGIHQILEKVGAPARVGLVAPIDVVVQPDNTGLDPEEVLNLAEDSLVEKFLTDPSKEEDSKKAQDSGIHQIREKVVFNPSITTEDKSQSELSIIQSYLEEKIESCADYLWNRFREMTEMKHGELCKHMKAESDKKEKALEELQKNVDVLREKIIESLNPVGEKKLPQPKPVEPSNKFDLLANE